MKVHEIGSRISYMFNTPFFFTFPMIARAAIFVVEEYEETNVVIALRGYFILFVNQILLQHNRLWKVRTLSFIQIDIQYVVISYSMKGAFDR